MEGSISALDLRLMWLPLGLNLRLVEITSGVGVGYEVGLKVKVSIKVRTAARSAACIAGRR